LKKDARGNGKKFEKKSIFFLQKQIPASPYSRLSPPDSDNALLRAESGTEQNNRGGAKGMI
jgi:hypothetical protein